MAKNKNISLPSGTVTIVAISGIIVILIGILFWPTLYRYEKIGTADGTEIIRINRISGKSKALKISRETVPPILHRGKRTYTMDEVFGRSKNKNRFFIGREFLPDTTITLRLDARWIDNKFYYSFHIEPIPKEIKEYSTEKAFTINLMDQYGLKLANIPVHRSDFVRIVDENNKPYALRNDSYIDMSLSTYLEITGWSASWHF